jgi:hypothetical protein
MIFYYIFTVILIENIPLIVLTILLHFISQTIFISLGFIDPGIIRKTFQYY